ncbi:hypothetical protein Bca4012_026826 [Brassica carinata]
MVKTTYDKDYEDEVIVYGETDGENSDDDVVLDNEGFGDYFGDFLGLTRDIGGISTSLFMGDPGDEGDQEIEKEQIGSSLDEGKKMDSELGKKQTYARAVQSTPQLLEHKIEVGVIDGKELVMVPDQVIQNSVPLWDDLIVGKFLSTAPHVARVHIIVNKIWPLGNKNIKIDAYEMNGTMIKFRIKDKATRERILRRGMWSIANIPMVVSKWAPIEEEEIEPEIKTIPMWITIKNVPRRMFSWGGLRFIASAVGKPKRLHPDTLLCNSFEEAKVFVEAEVAKGFPKKHIFTSKLGVDAEVEFTYPWLLDRCNICSKWGHLAKACRETEVVNSFSQRSERKARISTKRELKSMPETELSHQEEKEMGGKKEHEIVEIRSDIQQEEKQSKPVTAIQNSWSIVSPAKMGRVVMKQPENMQVGTPSRFAILEDGKEENEKLGKIDKGKYGDPEEMEPRGKRGRKTSPTFLK